MLFTDSHRNFEKIVVAVFVVIVFVIVFAVVVFLLILFLKLTKFYLWQVKSKVRKSSKQYILEKLMKYI